MSDTSIAPAIIITVGVVVVLAAVCAASIPAYIAAAKGHSWWAFFCFGFFFLPFALTTAYLLPVAPSKPMPPSNLARAIPVFIGVLVVAAGLVAIAYALVS